MSKMPNVRRLILCTILPALIFLMRSAPASETTVTMPKAIIDLSPTISEDFPSAMAGEKSLREFGFPLRHKFEQIIQREPFYIADSIYTMHNHLAPHYDPPTHLIEDGKSGDEVPLDSFYGRAKLFDFRTKPRDEPLLPSDFASPTIEPGDIVIAFVGYKPPADPEDLPSYPYMSAEAAKYLVGKSVKAVATDMPSLGSIRRYIKLVEEGQTGQRTFSPNTTRCCLRKFRSLKY